MFIFGLISTGLSLFGLIACLYLMHKERQPLFDIALFFGVMIPVLLSLCGGVLVIGSHCFWGHGWWDWIFASFWITAVAYLVWLFRRR